MQCPALAFLKKLKRRAVYLVMPCDAEIAQHNRHLAGARVTRDEGTVEGQTPNTRLPTGVQWR